MLHASVKAVGAVMGGPNTLLQALLEALSPNGTLMMYAGWEDIPDYLDELASEVQPVYYANHPPFDPAISRAVRENSILAEFLRTWPGAKRSLNPECSMVAVGVQAAYLTEDHPLNYGYGPGSPLEKLVNLKGKVLLLSPLLDNITLLHYAENRAKMRQKQVIHYCCPVIRDGKTVWLDIEDYETSEHHDDYDFEQIARAYLDEHPTPQHPVGAADSYLFDATTLVDFAIRWLETHFGQ